MTIDQSTLQNGSNALSLLLNGKDEEASKLLEMNGEIAEEDEATDSVATPGACVECEDQPAELHCTSCEDDYCQVCYDSQHRKGNRKRHATTVLTRSSLKKAKTVLEQMPTISNKMGEPTAADEDVMSEDSDNEVQVSNYEIMGQQPALGAEIGEWYVERAKYIPLRLTLGERKYLRLLEAALSVSEYTDKIDILGLGLSKTKRIVNQIRELCAIISGLLLSADYAEGQKLFADKDFESNAHFFGRIFELGRRHKIMNPDKMRTTYGKLMYLLQDAQKPEVMDMLGFSCVIPLVTVHSVLESNGTLDLLRDDLIGVATQEIYSQGRTRREVQRDIKNKEKAIETLSSRFSRGPEFNKEAVRQCLYSLGDNAAFLRVNRDPCNQMIHWLKQHFDPADPKRGASLAIRGGKGGARLTHDHARQYAYVIQSLTLWREILHDMFRLWILAEQDLLSTNTTYRLLNTGQGLNRVQAAPKTLRMMHGILDRAQKSVGSWIGSSVIHMGDHNVPNSFMFLDKYSQVYRILLPVTNALNQIPQILEHPKLKEYITTEFGSESGAYVEILSDFFKHGFDGSGADNFFDAGSCIDGRLTSAWHWCSQIEKKRYFPVFLLAGFTGFDGAF